MSSLLAANTVDAAALADELARFRVVDPLRLTELLAEFPGGGAAVLAEYLVRRGVLTIFQADKALAGESRALALGPYRLTALAGRGTFGPVYAASRNDRGGEYRLRVFPLRSLWKAREAKQLARLYASLQHPAVVPLLDVDSANGFHYLVWPCADGDPLVERVAALGSLSAGETIGLLAHLADALHACHVRRIVHGSLTPHSIILDRYGLPRLLELGAGAILAASLSDEEALLDTLSSACAAAEILKFAAPEFLADPTATPATDQYALGAIGYFALTGEPPFACPALTDWLALKSAGQHASFGESKTSIPEELARVVDRMLHPDPSERFSGLDEVQDRLADIAGGSGATERPSRLAEPEPGLPDFSSLFSSRDSRRSSNGSSSYSTNGSGVVDLPTRDDSDASITFELPPPTAEESLAFGMDRSALEDVPAGPSSALADLRGQSRDPIAPSRVSLEPPNPLPPSHSPVRTSPAKPEDLHMAKPAWPDPFLASVAPVLPDKVRPIADPRKGVSTPVHYHTETADEAASHSANATANADEQTLSDSVLWKKLKRNLLFWQRPTDALRVSVFGPPSIAPGQSAKITVFLHTPQTAESVRTLSRAFHHDSELIGTGQVAQEVVRDAELGVHLSVANAGVSKSLLTMTWRGQPHRLLFDLHVPWESPSGAAPGLVSIGRDNIRIGKIEFRLNLLPREG